MLVDTSTLVRTLQPLHPQREIVRSAIKALTGQGRELHIAPQNLVELGWWLRGPLNRTDLV